MNQLLGPLFVAAALLVLLVAIGLLGIGYAVYAFYRFVARIDW